MSDIVPSTLVYFDPPKDGSHPWQYVDVDPATGKRPSNFGRDHKEVQIENIRGKESTYSLDTSGFQYFTHPTTHKKFTDDKEIKGEYYPESVTLLKKFTGANRIIIFDHSMLTVFTLREKPAAHAICSHSQTPPRTVGHI